MQVGGYGFWEAEDRHHTHVITYILISDISHFQSKWLYIIRADLALESADYGLPLKCAIEAPSIDALSLRLDVNSQV